MSNVNPGPDGTIVLPDGTSWKIPPHPLSGRIQPAEELIPRVCIVPDYAFSSGQECIEVAASAGLVLDPWEELTIILGLGETAAGKWAAFMVALIVARQNGKGADLEALALYWLFGTGEKLIGHTAHEYKTAMEAFRRVLSLIENTDWMRQKVRKVINTNGEEGIELLAPATVITGVGSRRGSQMPGQRLRFLARSKGAGRGFTFGKLIWDEAYALTGEQQSAQLPTLSAVPNGQVWLTSSPPLNSETGQPLFALRRNAPTAPSVTFMDYGAAGSLEKLDQVDLDDRATWIRTNPNAPERISVEAMERERVAMNDKDFARERLCIWPPDLTAGYTVITKEQWEALIDPYSGTSTWPPELFPAPDVPMSALARMHPPNELTGPPVIAVDVAPRHGGPAPASLGLAGRRRDGRTHLELVKSGSGTAWLIRDIIKMCQKQTIRAIVIDPGSPAGSILADLKLALKEAGLDTDVEILEMSARDVAQAFGMIYDAATSEEPEGRIIAHLGQKELGIAVGGADTRDVGGTGGKAWDSRSATVDITGLNAVTHAGWGLAKLGDDGGSEPMVAWG